MNASRRAPVRSLKILCLASIAAVLASVPAQAQYFDRFDGLLPPRAVMARLSDRGFTEIARPRFDGRAYIVDATDRYGDRIRLFIDAEDGGVLGRQRLSAAPIRVNRPAPGFGWTEDDIERGRPLREAERMVPPANIPSVAPLVRAPRSEPADRNPAGLNPDATRPRAETPKKVVRLTPPTKPPAARITPEAPKVAAPSAAPAKPETPTAAIETPKVAPTTSPSAAPPAAEPKPAEASKTDGMVSSSAPPAQAWKDPPAETKRPVRVIDGATVVPGTTDKEKSGAD